MIFSVSNDGTMWSFVFEPGAVFLTVKDVVQGKPKKFPQNSSGSTKPVSETRFFKQPSSSNSNYPLPASEYGDVGWSTFTCRHTRHGDKQVWSVRSGGYWIHWEDLYLKMDAVLRPSMDTPFSCATSNGSVTENPILIDEEQDKENAQPLEATPVSERTTHPMWWRKVVPLEQELRIFSIMFTEIRSNIFD